MMIMWRGSDSGGDVNGGDFMHARYFTHASLPFSFWGTCVMGHVCTEEFQGSHTNNAITTF